MRVQELISFICIRNGSSESGRKTLLTIIIRKMSFFTLQGRYPKGVSEDRIIAIAYTGMKSGWNITDTAFAAVLRKSLPDSVFILYLFS